MIYSDYFNPEVETMSEDGLKAPGTIERSQGKSAHVVDKRKL